MTINKLVNLPHTQSITTLHKSPPTRMPSSDNRLKIVALFMTLLLSAKAENAVTIRLPEKIGGGKITIRVPETNTLLAGTAAVALALAVGTLGCWILRGKPTPKAYDDIPSDPIPPGRLIQLGSSRAVNAPPSFEEAELDNLRKSRYSPATKYDPNKLFQKKGDELLNFDEAKAVLENFSIDELMGLVAVINDENIKQIVKRLGSPKLKEFILGNNAIDAFFAAGVKASVQGEPQKYFTKAIAFKNHWIVAMKKAPYLLSAIFCTLFEKVKKNASYSNSPNPLKMFLATYGVELEIIEESKEAKFTPLVGRAYHSPESQAPTVPSRALQSVRES